MPLLLLPVFILVGVGLAYLLVTVYLVYWGSNYLPTPESDIATALSKLKSGMTLIDLGCGNGQVLQAALARKAGHVAGYEIDFVHYFVSLWKLWPAVLQGKCELYYQPIWLARVNQADIVYTYFTTYHLDQLYVKLQREMKPGAWFISYVHKVTGVKPTLVKGQLSFYKMPGKV